MTKSKIIFFLFIFSLVIVYQKASADNGTSTSATTTPVSATTTSVTIIMPQVPAIIQQVKSAKQQLESVKLNYDIRPVIKKSKKGKDIISRYELTTKDIALAILDPSSGQIKITVGLQNGKSMIFNDPNFDVKLSRFNGVNSSFQINQPANGTVLALKYLISGTETGSQKTIKDSLSESIYVPYSSALVSPEVVAYGQNYLNGIINKVTADLKFIPSQSIPGKQIVEAIPPALIKSLIYAEHSNAGEVLFGNPQVALDKLNILFATNLGDTYRYSVSTAGARGIAQFIPSTYTSLVKRHPEAGLASDFVAGMSDHENAIKAMYMLIDDYAGAVRVTASQGFASARVFDYGAASYNGGTTRVARAVNEFGDNWNQDRTVLINKLQSDIVSFNSQVKNLKAKIKTTKDKTVKTELQNELSAVSGQLSDANNQIANTKSATLRNETVVYLQKIYKVIGFINADSELN
jgi:hypothetical protein